MLLPGRCKMFNRERALLVSAYRSKKNLQLIYVKRGVYSQNNGRNSQYNNASMAEMPDTYTWKDSNHWNKVWEEEKYFRPKDCAAGKTFRMILPPPNVTGVLHLGHALTCTIQDVLARWRRMKGDSVVWVPGLDHAGIATQVVVEKYLTGTKGVDRYELGKDEFLACMKKWKDEKSGAIRNQLRDLGASLDWSREFFTMSKEHSEAVTEAFVELSRRGLLYRKEALINWSPSLRSAISDMEIEHVCVTKRTDLRVPGYEKKVPFGLIARVALKLRDSNEQLVIATTRVETMPGDVAVAVHPDDPRYSRYIGHEVWHPIRETFIPIIHDSSVERDFGTGVVKVTPAHDHADLVMARRHNLGIIDVIGNDGNMTENARSFRGLGRFVAREKILDELTRQGALMSLENHEMSVPVCSRSGDVVEYLLREQWFLKTKEMAERAVQAVSDGSLNIDPPEWAELWCNWLGNNRDWCVSRQIWWGHRIPAYRCRGSDWTIARSEKEARQQLARTEKPDGDDLTIEQDQDVLDTWFSSALLPLSAVGWPDSKYERFYPLSLMETGHDIIFLWVARMVMLSTELTNTLPFKEVLLHGVLCDAQGKKMSKSRGNVIRPEHVINGISLEELNAEAEASFKSGILSKEELKRTLTVNGKMFPDGIPECGTDALRLTLCAHNIKSSRTSFNVIECRTNKHFCNKIWQAARYVLRTIDESDRGVVKKPDQLSTVDRWILSKLSLMVDKVNDAFENRNFYKAVLAIKQFFYYEFCDYFLEATKPAFRNEQRAIAEGHMYSLAKCLEVSLRVLAPITPYLCDDLYSRCAKKLPEIFSSLPSLAEAPYPTFGGDFESSRDPQLEEKFDRLLDVVGAIRNVLAQVTKKSDAEVHVVTDLPDGADYFAENIDFLAAVTRVRSIRVLPSRQYAPRENSILCSDAAPECRVFVLLASEADVSHVKEKMEKKRQQSAKKLEKLRRRVDQSKLATKPESERLQDQEEMQNAEAELKRYPKLS